jgi:hypothetical protein
MESSQNENIILIDGENEICLNEYNMENEILNENIQIKQSIAKRKIARNEKMTIQTNFQKPHVQRKYGKVIIRMQFFGFFIM